MDIPRPPAPRHRRYLQGGIAAGAVVLLTIFLTSLKPAAPSVDRGTLWVDSVRRGEMVREVRGPGTLVPEHIRFITALAAGRVDRVLAQPGQRVTPETVLLALSNPDVQIQALQAEQQLTAARAELVSLNTNLNNQRLTQAGLVATTRTEHLQAQREAAVAESLGSHGGMSRNDVALAKDKAAELETRYGIEQQRLQLMTETIDSQLAVQRSQVDRLRAVAEFQQNVLRSLRVRAGDSGVVSDLTLQLGQYVLAGTMLAKVVQPGKLKAVVQIPETQAKDVAIGQKAAIDTRNGIVPGHVIRFDPNAINGTVAVDVALEGAVAGMRPDLSVDGTIEIERLEGVLYAGRPAYGQPNGLIGMFRISPDGHYATRVQVQLGRSSVSTVEIVRGLNVRDSVILSDMSQWDNVDRVRIKR
ncbi:MAG TPA: HlyD family efflux transporter periplasmic adaptor subunit [Gemmatimonadales bacterium]|nr:HlyD family efflux transporter periplasmic adaptor subunit [Gemmatimonadales bacterium]